MTLSFEVKLPYDYALQFEFLIQYQVFALFRNSPLKEFCRIAWIFASHNFKSMFVLNIWPYDDDDLVDSFKKTEAANPLLIKLVKKCPLHGSFLQIKWFASASSNSLTSNQSFYIIQVSIAHYYF